ncbi:MAG: DUF4286 family protein [Muribaculaceae bacterium]|nr:DUF4286 family protein [Muribaculaceae bacterium]
MSTPVDYSTKQISLSTTMYILNTSFHIDHAHFSRAVDFVKQQLIPALTESGVVTDPLLLELLIDVDPAMRSFSLQLHTADIEKAAELLDAKGQPLIAELIKSCGGPEHAVTFTTPMQIID